MLKIEKKISFTVAGIEFQNLKTAQFFARAVNLHNQDSSSDSAHVARDLLDTWAAATHEECEDEELVEVVMGLQMPKPARKPAPKKFTSLAEVLDLKKNVQVLAGDPLEFGPAPGEQEEIEFPTIPGVYGKDAIDAFDTTFAEVSTPVDVTPYFLSSNLTD